jgi:hypothetical protein
MAIVDRFINTDNESGNAYLRARGAEAPEKLINKFRSSGIVPALPGNTRAAQINIIDSSGQLAYLDHESRLELAACAIRDGVAL